MPPVCRPRRPIGPPMCHPPSLNPNLTFAHASESVGTYPQSNCGGLPVPRLAVEKRGIREPRHASRQTLVSRWRGSVPRDPVHTRTGDHTRTQLRVRGLSDRGGPSSSVRAPIEARELPIWNVCQAIVWRGGRVPDIIAFSLHFAGRRLRRRTSLWTLF